MKQALSIIILLLPALELQAQSQNFVPNPSFENHNACPQGTGQMILVDDWTGVTNHGGSADYFHACSPNPDVMVPNNVRGYQNAALGDAYIGLTLIYNPIPNFREYAQVRLINPMQANYTYIVTLKYSLAEVSQQATDRFGVHISDSAITGTGDWFALPVTPQLWTSPGDYITDMQNWRTFTFPYIAIGGEEYLTLGNFANDASTNVISAGTGTFDGSYIYIDEVEVYLGSTSCLTQLQMPNVFTPNNDNQNDVFVPANSTGVLSGTLEIYNRWGQEVFTTSDLLTGWTGNINNLPAPDGVYYWISTYIDCNNREQQATGTLTLLR